MKIFKKIMTTVLTIALLTSSLAGCSNKDKENKNTDGSDSLSADFQNHNTDKKTIAIITPSLDNPLYKIESDEVDMKARELGYEPIILSHDGTIEGEEACFTEAILRNVSLIICDVQHCSDSAKNVVLAKDKVIPVIVINNALRDTGIANLQIVSDNYEGAKLLAEKFVEKVGTKGKFAEILGNEADDISFTRSSGFVDVLAQYPELEMVVQESGNWLEEDAYKIAKKVIEKFPDIKGFLCGNDEMALAVLKAVKEANLKDVAIVGYGGSNEIKESIKNGDILATALQPVTLFATTAVERADEILNNKAPDLEEMQSFISELIDSSNVDKLNNYVLNK